MLKGVNQGWRDWLEFLVTISLKVLMVLALVLFMVFLISVIDIRGFYKSPVCRAGYLFDTHSDRQIISETGGGIKCDLPSTEENK